MMFSVTRWQRFSITASLVALAMLVGCHSRVYNAANQQRLLVKELNAAGAGGEFKDLGLPHRAFWAPIVGKDYYRRLHHVHFYGSNGEIWTYVNDEDEDPFLSFGRDNQVDRFSPKLLLKLVDCDLEQLDFVKIHLTEADFQTIGKMTTLKTLKLSETTFDEQWLRYLVGLDQLEKLSIVDLTITDAGVEYIVKLQNLQTLYLPNNRISPAGVRQLSALSHLNEVSLSRMMVSSTGLPSMLERDPASFLTDREEPLMR